MRLLDPENGLTLRTLVIGLAFNVFWVIFGTAYLVWGMREVGPWWHWWFFEALFVYLIALVLMKLITKALGSSLTHKEMSILWALILPSALLPWAAFLFISGFIHAGASPRVDPEVRAFIPAWLCPKIPEALYPLTMEPYRGMFHSAWIPVMLAMTVILLLWQTWWVWNAVIWRDYYIKVERLDFPGAQIVYELSANLSNLLRNGRFLLGLAIGFGWYLPFLIAQLIEQPYITGATIYGTANWPNCFGWTTIHIPNSYYIGAFIGIHLLLIALGYFLPIDILLTITVGYLIVWVIVPAIAVATHLVPAPTDTGFWGIYWGWGFTQGITAVIMFTYGGLLGLAIAELVFGARHIGSTIAKAIREITRRERFSDAPIPYSVAWILWIVCFFGLVAAMVASGVPLANALLLMIFFYLTFLAQIRICAEVGVSGNHWYQNWANVVAALPFISAGTYHTKEAFMTALWAGNIGGTGFFEGNFAERSMISYKLGDRVGVSPRAMFIAQLLGVVVATIVLVPFWIWFTINFGWHGDSWAGVRLALDVYKEGAWTQAGAWPLVFANYIIGAVIVFILAVLRRIAPTIRFNPVGLVIMAAPWVFFGSPVQPGLSDGWAGVAYGGCWFSIGLVPLIIKYLVLKIGGVESYKKWAPLFLGIILSITVLAVLPGLKYLIMNFGSWGTVDRWTKY